MLRTASRRSSRYNKYSGSNICNSSTHDVSINDWSSPSSYLMRDFVYGRNSLPTRTGLLKQQRQCRTMMTMMMQHARSSSFVPYNGNNISNNTRANANAYILNNDSIVVTNSILASASSIDTRSEEEEQTRSRAHESRNDH